ncbi:PQQ-binding-like beta-propeller repeat protein [Lignipirellula cremea]|uniref:Serine/threonine-protein kinase AfsK n=1 Tax=Lignipirellula cremea TaxID=2528010 RepID=A0A518E1I1_9BACT|nr:PQQ-binding-like beta-propeller repeat protein [Lignipirellula cremea]QDU97934.1 Serine/threonine-protein kinase AfsK [Lignipirellula cremea]
MNNLLARLVLLLAAFAPSLAFADDAAWPQFRGPDGQGRAEATNLPLTWSETENVVWKTPLEAQGWSSPVIEGNEIWMTAATPILATEEEKKQRLASNTGNQPLLVAKELRMRAVCVDRTTGKILHDAPLMTQGEPDPVHTLNSFASPTPVIENGRLYCHFGTNGTACLDTQSLEVVWTNRELQINHENGPGSSPVLHGDLLYIHFDGSDQQYVVALDKRTGEVVWKTDRSGKMDENPQLKKAYGTPLVVAIDGQEQLISPGSDWLYSYDLKSGRELWKLNYGVLGFSIVPRPVTGHGMIYMCTSFMKSELLAVQYADVAEPKIAWRFNRQAPQQPSPLLVGDELYLAGDRGVATCLDAKTGEVLWSQRLGGNYSASPLFADGKIYFSSREGVTTVIQPGRTYQELAVNKLDGQIMASLAAVDQALYIRTDKALYRIEKK